MTRTRSIIIWRIIHSYIASCYSTRGTTAIKSTNNDSRKKSRCWRHTTEGPIQKQTGSYGAQDCNTGTERGDRKRRGEGTDIDEGKITGNHVPPQIKQAPIWGTDTLTKERLRKKSEELSEDPYPHVRANDGI